jgi:signal transduction histidine kinase
LVAVISLVAMTAALVNASLRNAEHRDVAAERELHSVTVMNETQGLLTALVDVETGQRGYALTGDRRFLKPYDDGLRALDRHLRTVGTLTSDNEVQRANLKALRDAVDSKVAFTKARIAETNVGDLDSVRNATRAGEGHATMIQARTIVAAILAEEDRLLRIRAAKAEAETAAARRALRRFVVLGVALLLTATAGMVLALRAAAQARSARLDSAIAQAVQRDLEARVEERTRALLIADEKVRQMQKMEAVGQLTGGLAHDFNNMLAVIIGSLDMARRRITQGADNIGQYIDYAMDGAQRAAELTRRLLAFARQQPLAPSVIDANALVQGMSELLRRTLGEAVELETVLAGGLWRTNVDAGQVESALLNLAVNARDAIDGSGRLTIETANAALDDHYARTNPDAHPGQYVMIAVSDTGAGMTQDVIARSFDPFFTTKPVGRGTGLGLSQVYGFIKQSGGHLKIYSEPGHGTSVKIYLPRHTGNGSERQIEVVIPDVVPRASAGESILVVEDDDRVRIMSVEALRDLGYHVVHAASGVAALDMIGGMSQLTLLFTDIVMPGMTGRQLADAVSAIRPEIRVLYTTGYTRNAVVHDGKLDAGVAFLAKPFTVAQLAVKVRSTIDRG